MVCAFFSFGPSDIFESFWADYFYQSLHVYFKYFDIKIDVRLKKEKQKYTTCTVSSDPSF